MLKIPWQLMLIEIHGGGMSWVGLSRRLGSYQRSVERYARGEETLKITFERGVIILQLYAAIFPERYDERVRPFLRIPGDRVSNDAAVEQLMRGAP